MNTEDNSLSLEDSICIKNDDKHQEMLKTLQKEVVEFVTSVILNHEEKFYQLVKNFPQKFNSIVGLTNKTIIDMIVESTNHFYNKLYFDVQKQEKTDLVEWINKMMTLVDYGPHILIIKLIEITLNVHLDITREELSLGTIDLYKKSILQEINLYFQNNTLYYSLEMDEEDYMPLVHVPDNEKPFTIKMK